MKLAIKGGSPVRKNFLPYGKQTIEDSDVLAVSRALKSDYLTQGPLIEKFESKLASYCSSKYALVVSSGTAALHTAVHSLGLSKGDKAITTPITFAATANSVRYVDAEVQLADIDINNYNIDPKQIIEGITKETKAILPVDLTGQPSPIDEINEIAEENDIAVVEDCCHAFGAEYKGRRVGSLSDINTFSFHPVKHFTTGEGGVLLTNNEEIYNKALKFRTHGITKEVDQLTKNDGGWYYEMQELGQNYRLTDIQCALGISQLSRVDDFIKRRIEIAKRYDDQLSRIEEVIIPFQEQYSKSSYHLYVIRFDLDKISCTRKDIYDALNKENIGTQVHYIPLYRQPYYLNRYKYLASNFPNSEKYYETALSLPIFPHMTDDDVQDVIDAISKIIKYYAK